MKKIAIVTALVTLFTTSAFARKRAETPHEPCEKKLVGFDLIKFDKNTYSYQGLSAKGLALLKKNRDALRARKTLFEKDFQSMSAIYKAITEARLSHNNAILSGPKGAAKSLIINKFLEGESKPVFKIQVHGMTSEIPMIGGQTFESAQKGTYDHNIAGSLADHEVGLVDEGEKGPAGTMASLLSVANPGERTVLAGGQEFKAKIRTIYATTNSSLAALMDHFVQGGQPHVGPAWANRFLYKVWIQNWLPKDKQAILDERIHKREYLKALAANDRSVLKDEVFTKFPPVDWDEMKSIARALFKTSENFQATYRDLADNLRESTNDAIKQSEKLHMQNPGQEPYVYTPAADWSERLRGQVPETVIYSAFHDFLLSPLADDDVLEANIKKQIELDPSSLWRAYSTLAMISSGSVRPTMKDGKFDIEFERVLQPEKARDRAEEKEIENMIAEQERFRTTFLKDLKEMQTTIDLFLKTHMNADSDFEPTVSFELQLMKSMGWK